MRNSWRLFRKAGSEARSGVSLRGHNCWGQMCGGCAGNRETWAVEGTGNNEVWWEQGRHIQYELEGQPGGYRREKGGSGVTRPQTAARKIGKQLRAGRGEVGGRGSWGLQARAHPTPLVSPLPLPACPVPKPSHRGKCGLNLAGSSLVDAGRSMDSGSHTALAQGSRRHTQGRGQSGPFPTRLCPGWASAQLSSAPPPHCVAPPGSTPAEKTTPGPGSLKVGAAMGLNVPAWNNGPSSQRCLKG